MLKRTAAVACAALVLALGGTGAALAANGADDAPGHHQEHRHGDDNGKHHLHRNKGGDDHGGKMEPGDDNGGHGEEPGDDNGGNSGH
jgi:hypothetical protein